MNVYGFFVLPASDKPIVIQEDVRTLIQAEPVWVERATLPAHPDDAREAS